MGFLKRPAAAPKGGVTKKLAIADYASSLQERLSQIDKDDEDAMHSLDSELKKTITKAQRHSSVKMEPWPSLETDE